MKKYIVLSVNDNADYLYFTPLVIWAWKKFGWEPFTFYQRDKPNKDSIYWDLKKLIRSTQDFYHVRVDSIDGYRSDTITQISRLYAGIVLNVDDYAMTGDIDMLPLSDYWKPDTNQITIYGHDLTGFGHYPICYIGMGADKWRYIMKMSMPSKDFNKWIQRDLDTLPQAKDPDFYKYWFSDQDLITARLNEYGKEKITFINRGQGSHGYARGRVDRGSGGWVLNQPELIDAHLEQQTHHKQEKIERLYALLKHVWPNEDFTWFRDYTMKFRELTGHKG